MATQFAHPLFSFRPAAPPFAASRETAVDPVFAAALRKAVAAERVAGQVRNPRQRIALLLCELGKALGCSGDFPLSRAALAAALGISLVRVKRTLALLCLSGVLSCEDDRIEVLDWRKLSGAARVDPAELGMDTDEEEERPLFFRHEASTHVLTASGEPACFT